MRAWSNGLAASCSAPGEGCGFEYRPFGLRVTHISPRRVGAGGVLRLAGSQFVEYPGTEVSVGGVPCVINASRLTDSYLECVVGGIPGGNHTVEVRNPVMGLAAGPAVWAGGSTVEAALVVSGVFPASGSLHGGTILTISGAGFAPAGAQNVVTLRLRRQAAGGGGQNGGDGGDGGGDDGKKRIRCIPKTMRNYMCAPYGLRDCPQASVYGWVDGSV